MIKDVDVEDTQLTKMLTRKQPSQIHLKDLDGAIQITVDRQNGEATEYVMASSDLRKILANLYTK